MGETGGAAARVGLVLGAGGVLGGAWMVGALDAVQRETGWDPRQAVHLVGTSAGSVLAAALGAGTEVERLLPMSPDWIFKGLFDTEDELILQRELGAKARRLPWWPPGSWRLVLAGFRFDGHRPSWLRMLSGLVPQGVASTAPIRETVRRLAGEGWSAHPRCWIVACDYETGRRRVFGRAHDDVNVAAAVAASCAIPGFYCPQRVGDRLYVDGALHSMSNLDLMAQTDVDLAICLNPLSSAHRSQSWDPLERFLEALRRHASHQLLAEAELLQRRGIRTLLLQPGEEDLAAMGSDLMAGARSRDVVRLAQRGVTAQLRQPAVRELLDALGLGPATASARRAS